MEQTHSQQSHSHEEKMLTVYGRSDDARRHILTLVVITAASLTIIGTFFLAPMQEGNRFLLAGFYYAFCLALVVFRAPLHIAMYTWGGQNDLNIRGNFNEGYEHQVGRADDFSFTVDDQCLRFKFADQKPLSLPRSRFSEKSINLIRDTLAKVPEATPKEFRRWLSGQGIPFRMIKKNYHLPDLVATEDDYVCHFRFAETSSYLIWQRVYFAVCGITVVIAMLIARAQGG